MGAVVLNKLALVLEKEFWPRGTHVVSHAGVYANLIVSGRALIGLTGGADARSPVPEPVEELLRSLKAPKPIAAVFTRWHDGRNEFEPRSGRP